MAPLGRANSSSLDHLPWLSNDELTLHFSSSRASESDDIFRATRAAPGSAFDPPVAVSELNSTGVDSGITPSEDTRVAIFASDRSGGLGSIDLYQATRATVDDPFSTPVPLDTLNSAAMDLDPELSPDGTELFFISLRNGSETQLFRASRSCP